MTRSVIAVVVLSGQVSCATIGPKVVNVAVTGNAGGNVTLDGVPVGVSPMVLPLEAHREHIIGVGAQSCFVTTSTQAGLAIVDFVFGILPLVIDVATGSLPLINTDTCPLVAHGTDDEQRQVMAEIQSQPAVGAADERPVEYCYDYTVRETVVHRHVCKPTADECATSHELSAQEADAHDIQDLTACAVAGGSKRVAQPPAVVAPRIGYGSSAAFCAGEECYLNEDTCHEASGSGECTVRASAACFQAVRILDDTKTTMCATSLTACGQHRGGVASNVDYKDVSDCFVYRQRGSGE